MELSQQVSKKSPSSPWVTFTFYSFPSSAEKDDQRRVTTPGPSAQRAGRGIRKLESTTFSLGAMMALMTKTPYFTLGARLKLIKVFRSWERLSLPEKVVPMSNLSHFPGLCLRPCYDWQMEMRISQSLDMLM